MYLLIGSPDDPCCASVHAALAARGCRVRTLDSPSRHPARWSWRLDGGGSTSELFGAGEDATPDGAVQGVLVRGAAWFDPDGWQPADLAYMQAEAHASLLGWLWSLHCPVVNRYPADLWYRPQVPLLSWRSRLDSCGLPALAALVSNVEEEARRFGRRVASCGGAVYRPLTSDARYLIATEADWGGLAAMQRRAPICLTPAHARPRSACVVGGQVVWDDAAPHDAGALEPALCRFAAAAGLTFVEVAVAESGGCDRVVAVEHHPRFDRFGNAAQQAIVAALVDLLTAQADAGVAPPRARDKGRRP